MDRTKCSNNTCSLRLNCLRFTGKASEYQSYTRFEPVDNKCEYKIDATRKRKRARKDNSFK